MVRSNKIFKPFLKIPFMIPKETFQDKLKAQGKPQHQEDKKARAESG